MGECFSLEEVVSDHKILHLRIKMQICLEKEFRFRPVDNLVIPRWLDHAEWKTLIDEAVHLGRRSDWMAVGHSISTTPKWVATDSRCVPP